jgi:Skp family chaperone for outer membrane proteins
MESIAEIERRHEQERKELQEKVKGMLKGAKKSQKAQLEAEAIQLEFDLKAKHREEIEEAEEKGAPAGLYLSFC